MRNILPAALSALLLASAAAAEPLLQVDIAGGSYSTSGESTVTSANVFTVYALLTPKANDNVQALLADTYYLSVALTPALASYAGAESVSIDGVSKNISSFAFGRPPIEAVDDNGDLAPHDIFDTLFYEHAFSFNAAQRTTTYNVQNLVGVHVAPVTVANGGTYYVGISIDRTLLSSGKQLHFDLYSTSPSLTRGQTAVATGGETIKDFAPFSHDAQTVPCTSDCGGGNVPEPASLLLLGTGLALVARRVSRRR